MSSPCSSDSPQTQRVGGQLEGQISVQVSVNPASCMLYDDTLKRSLEVCRGSFASSALPTSKRSGHALLNKDLDFWLLPSNESQDHRDNKQESGSLKEVCVCQQRPAEGVYVCCWECVRAAKAGHRQTQKNTKMQKEQ